MPRCGTGDHDRMWCNANPDAETKVNMFGAYLLTFYADAAVIYFCFGAKLWYWVNGVVFLCTSFMALWAHTKTMITDPGTVPNNVIPPPDGDGYCVKCDRFKPRAAYHCSKCERCVVRMDHHCPYTNNCVGARNQKHMILFLLYCNVQAVYAIVLCAFYGLQTRSLAAYSWPARLAAAALFFDAALTLAFTGTMLSRQILAVATGIGTIDRLKLAKGKPIAGGTPHPLSHVFGEDCVVFWWLPIDPDFGDEEHTVMGFRTSHSPAIRLKPPRGFDEAKSQETPLLGAQYGARPLQPRAP